MNEKTEQEQTEIQSSPTPPGMEKTIWNKEDLLNLSEAFNKHKIWVYILTGVFILSAITQLISFNLIGLAMSSVLLMACWQAIEAIKHFDNLTNSLETEDSITAIEKLKQYYFYTTIYLGITILMLGIGIIVLILALFLIVFLGLSL